MDLSFQAPDGYLFIRSVTDEGILVGDTTYKSSLVISAEQIWADWDVGQFSELQAENLQILFDFNPDLVLLGTGAKQHFPSAEIFMEFHRRGIGIEVMGTHAACRTFNVLVSESRRVIAALLPVNA
jgi:uncharacterized protein